MHVVSTVLAFLCLAVPPSCNAFVAPLVPAASYLRAIHRNKTRTNMRAPTVGSTRRVYFKQLLYRSVATVALSGASSLVLPPRLNGYAYEENGSKWAPEGDPKAAASWFPLLTKCYQSLEDVVANWEKYTVKQDGDAIRRLIGTIGVSSPLSSIRKAFVSIRDAEEDSQGDIDVIEYVEAYMEVLTALGDAENDLYSANFADYSGGGGTKGSQFMTKANKSLKIARDEFKVVNRILGI